MNTNQNHIGWSFWLQWAIATTVGFIIGGAITGALVMAAEIRFASVTSPWTGAIALAIANAVAFGLFGTALGSAQWFVLRHAIAQLSSWVLATASGWATAGIVSGIIGGGFAGVLAGLIYGAITGAVMIRLLQQPKSFSSARTALQDA